MFPFHSTSLLGPKGFPVHTDQKLTLTETTEPGHRHEGSECAGQTRFSSPKDQTKLEEQEEAAWPGQEEWTPESLELGKGQGKKGADGSVLSVV